MKIQTALASVAFAFAVLSLSPLAASAETEAERRACTGDAFQFCARYIPDRSRVAACLASNIDRISYACRTVMESYSRPAETNRDGYRYYR